MSKLPRIAVAGRQVGVGAAAVWLLLLAQAATAITEMQRFSANDAAPNDRFGISVGISGPTAIVGSFNDDGVATDTGSAYIFRNPGSGMWSQLTKLTAADAAQGDNFGVSVAISGNVAVIGANFDDGRGSAYIFRDSSPFGWMQLDKILASDAAANDQFGAAVAISGNTAVVGARLKDSGIGAAYVFRDNGDDDWQQIAKLTPSDGGIDYQFGNSVAISGNTVLVGAHRDTNVGGSASGAVYVFQDNGNGVWSQAAKLLPADGSQLKQFGTSLAFSGNTAVVGAVGDNTLGTLTGAAYVFERDALSKWHQSNKLLADDAGLLEQFGISVALSGNTAVVGANQDTQGGAASGAAYVFRNNGQGNWNQIAKMRASDFQAGDAFGTAVALSGTTALVGAPFAGGVSNKFSGASYRYNVPSGLAGDYNANGRVDTADFVVWRNTVGATGILLAADGNGDGVVNQADYQLWRENFGITAPGAAGGSIATVPEPATIVLIWTAGYLFVHRRVRRPFTVVL